MGFEEAISAHMGTLSYKIGRKVEWDYENNRVKDLIPPNNWTDEEIQRCIASIGKTAI